MVSKDKVVLSFILFFIIPTTQATQYNRYKTIQEALEHGDPYLNFRLRHEHAHQEDLTSAKAWTIKSQLGYQSASFYQHALSLEMINVSNFLGQHYNPNVDPLKKPGLTTINDPKGTGITNANITSEYFFNTEITLGRQYITINNSRMVGNDEFRQFPTSFDALTIKNNSLEDCEIFYGFANHINTFKNTSTNTDGRRKLSANLLNLTWQNFTYGQISIYGYGNKDLSVIKNSNTTFGTRVMSDKTFKQVFKFGYELEAAVQKNNSNNPNKYSAFYFGMSALKDTEELFKTWVFTAKAGYEFLGSHSIDQPGYSFVCPLGASHGFNGLAEGYIITPTRGLTDYYASLGGQYLDNLDLTGTIHLFQFAKGSHNKLAGLETDLSMSFKITKDLSTQIIFAKLNAENSSTRSVKRISGSINYTAM